MRVCHVVYGYFPFDPRVRREVDTLRRQGHKIDVISMREPGESIRETLAGVRVHRIPFEVIRGGSLRYLFQYVVFFLAASSLLLKLHWRHRFQLVHVHSLPDFQVFGALPEKLAGVRVLLDLHEAMPEILSARMRLPSSSFRVRLATALERASCAFADHVFVVNETIRSLLIGRGADGSKISVVMNSPDRGDLRPGDPGKLRADLGLAGQRAVVYVGGINAERDLGLLVQAVARLRSTHHLRLAIFGYGDPAYREILEAIARREGMGGEFILGPRLPPEEVFSYISLSEVGPVTYERNPLTELAVPNKVFEYAAAGKPLVIANLEALRSLFGDSALYYEPGNAADLARQIRRLLDEEGLGERMRLRATLVLDACAWEVMGERIAAAYAKLGEMGG